jgi:Protein of unknown function (DUF2846)
LGYPTGGEAMKSLFALFFLTILTVPVVAQDQATARAAAGCGPANVEFDVKTDKKQHSEATPEAGKALVYVFEEEKQDPGFVIGAVTTRIGLDGQWVGANHGKSYFFFSVDPGDHNLCASWQSSLSFRSKLASAASLAAEAGKVYYFRAKVDERTHEQSALKMELVDPAEGKLLLADSALSEPHPKK